LKLLVDIIDWEYPGERQEYCPSVWDLTNNNTLLGLILAFGNGVILEFRAEADSVESLAILEDIITNVGGCKPAKLSHEEQQHLWFYTDECRCYTQGTSNPAYIFVHPIPQPHKF
jgi:hypothetical protein